jgi:hypothetical protein
MTAPPASLSRKPPATFGPTARQNRAAVFRAHSMPKSVFVGFFPQRWLKSALHNPSSRFQMQN